MGAVNCLLMRGRGPAVEVGLNQGRGNLSQAGTLGFQPGQELPDTIAVELTGGRAQPLAGGEIVPGGAGLWPGSSNRWGGVVVGGDLGHGGCGVGFQCRLLPASGSTSGRTLG